MEGKKKLNFKKFFCIIISSLLSIIILSVLVFYGIFFNETNALFSIKKLKQNIYTMNYRNDYYFDDFLKVGAKSDSELLSFLMSKLLEDLPVSIEAPNLACSSFYTKTAEGEVMHSRNFDLDDTPMLILKTKPRNGYSSISTVNLTFLGYNFTNLPDNPKTKFACLAAPYVPLDGINEKGVAISVNMLNGQPANQETDKIDITTTTLIRLVLDKADSVESAINLINQYDLHDSANMPHHYHITDAQGNSAIVEYINNEIKLTESKETLYQTNFILSEPSLADDFGKDRYDIIDRTIKSKNGILSKNECFDLLKAVKMDWETGGTQWSVVFDLTNKAAIYCFYADFEERFDFNKI